MIPSSIADIFDYPRDAKEFFRPRGDLTSWPVIDEAAYHGLAGNFVKALRSIRIGGRRRGETLDDFLSSDTSPDLSGRAMNVAKVAALLRASCIEEGAQ